MEKYTIYDNYSLWENEEEAKNQLLEEGYSEEEITDRMVRDTIYSRDEMDWDNLKYTLEHMGNDYIIVGTVGTRRGRMDGASKIGNPYECLLQFATDCDYIKIESDGTIQASHHDGTNYGKLLKIRKNLNETQLEKLNYWDRYHEPIPSRYLTKTTIEL